MSVHGRLDDTYNLAGHRIGSAEIEAVVLSSSEKIVECASTAIPNNDLLESLIVVIVLESSFQKDNKVLMSIKNSINNNLINNCGTWVLPKVIYCCDVLPKTKSGKILRRFIKEFLITSGTKDAKKYPTVLRKDMITDFHLYPI